MKKYLLLPALLLSSVMYAQVPEDVLRYSFYPQNGTARSLAIGGAMGSLGGDISATFVNPAGLGNYKTGEFVFTPGWQLNNNKTTFRDTKTNNNKNNFALGPIGFVFGASDNYNPKNSQAISLVFTQVASYNNNVNYKGLNNYSSFTDQWTEQQWAKDIEAGKQNIDGTLNDPNNAYGAAPALYTYLIDTFRVNGQLQVGALPENVLAVGHALMQDKTIRTSGGLYEIALGYASNKNDKLLIGGSLGVPILNYKNSTSFRESDTSADKTNGFDYLEYTDNFSTKGIGINIKLGLIYKIKEHIRLGFAVHTPTYMFTVKDTRNTSLTANTENYNGTATITSATFTNGQDGESKYTMLTPLKMMISGSYVFSEIQDVRKQKGFITADIEYISHRGSRFYSAAENPSDDDVNYYKALNNVVKSEYKGNFNFRVGGELKFNTIMARLGFAYYTNPYKVSDAALKAHRMLLSSGLGYRHKGFFIDLTYVHSFNKDIDFAYRLAERDNTFATVNTQRGNIIATFGVKF